jgi:hypothetical protein
VGDVDDEVYIPYLQRPGAFGLTALTFVIRTELNPDALKGSVERTMRGIDSGIAVSNIQTMEQVISDK